MRRLLRARAALAGVEFALVLPFLLALLAGLVDVSLAVITSRRVTAAAEDVALVASTMAVQASAVNTLTGLQAWQATTAPFAVFPAWRNKGADPFSITLSGVEFTATPAGCNTGCTGYAAATRWSVGNRAGRVVLRPCGALAAVADGSGSGMGTLPAGVFGATSLLVGDVSTVWTPPMSGVFTGTVTFLRSAFIPPRVNNGVQLTGTGPGQAVTCPKQGS